jgi:hypothetical protein
MEGSSWHQERVDMRTGGSGLEDNDNASKGTIAALKRTEMRVDVPQRP